jgi:hypothetical protein
MDEAMLKDKVGQLLSEVQRMPASPAVAPIDFRPTASQASSTMKREMAALEETLDQVRLAIKYLVFDLEATKRENRVLKELLEGM